MSNENKKEVKLELRGGARRGAGRPVLWGTQRLVVPKPLIAGFKTIIAEYKKSYKLRKY